MRLFGQETTNEDVSVPKTALKRDSYTDLAVFILDRDALSEEAQD